MLSKLLALLAVVVAAAACDATPDYFPPCVNPDDPCVFDAGEDAAPDARADAKADATGDAPADATAAAGRE